MATEVKRRRGTTLEHTTTNGGFTGAEGELTVDTTKDTVVVHDGSTLGGFPLLREDFSNVTTLKVDTTYSEDGNEVQGEMYWNSDEETVTLVTNGFNLPIGHSLILNVKNDDEAQDNISKGDVVAANGTVGASGKITVTRFQAGTTPTRTIVGIAGEDIIYGEFGKVVAFGKIRKIDTATPESGSWNEGDILYASTTVGALTKTAPTAGNVKLPIAYVVTDHASNGEIFVRITPIDENEFQQYDADLSTIAGLAKTDGNFIVGNGSAWVAESGSTARTSLGLSIGSDVQAWNAQLDTLSGLSADQAADLVAITASEYTQLQNIGSTTISSTQWGYLGGLDQALTTGSNVSFGDLTLSGDLTVSGTTTYINTQHLNIGDAVITLNADLDSGTAPTENVGIQVNRGSSADKYFYWDETNDRWYFDDDVYVYDGSLVLTNLDGSASPSPTLELFRASGTPASSDDIGEILFSGYNDAPSKKTYSRIWGEIADASAGTENGNLYFNLLQNNSLNNVMKLASSGSHTITGALAVSGNVTGSNLAISNWNTAYGWGNHANVGYLTSFDITTQTDPKYLRSDAADTASELITFSKGISSDGNAKFYSWRAIDNTSNSSNLYYKIARVTASQSTRFSIELAGRSTSYSDTKLPAMGYIVGQLNNDNNYDIIYYNHSTNDSEVANEVGQVDIDTTSTDIYIKIGQYAEITATAHISDGTITPQSNTSSSGVANEPTNYVAVTETKVWNSVNDGPNSGLDADTLDGQHASAFLTSYTETDPVFSASEAASITSTDTSQWDAAYTYSQVGHLPLSGGTVTGMTIFEDGMRVGTGNHYTDGRASITFGEGATTTDSMYIEYDGENLSGDSNGIFIGSAKAGVGDVLKVEYGGNVGIGTASPSKKLDVRGEVALDIMPAFQQEGEIRIGRSDGTSRYHRIRAYNDSTAANNYLRFDVHNGTVGSNLEVLALMGDGNVGIGTTSPSYNLTVRDDSAVPEFAIEHFDTPSDDDTIGSIFFRGNLIDDYDTNTILSENTYAEIRTIATDTSDNSADSRIEFRTESGNTLATRMSINGGNVGIGTTSPDTILDIAGTTPTLTINDTQSKSWVSGNELGGISWRTNDPSGVGAREVGFIHIEAETGGTTMSGAMVFGSSAYNASATERMRIDSSGNVGIGTTSPWTSLVLGSDPQSGTPNAGVALAFEGASYAEYGYRFRANGANYYQVLYNGSAINWKNYSSGAYTTRMSLTNGGNVGIGTTSPEYILDIGAENTENPTDFIRLNPTNGNSTGTSNTLGTGVIWKPNYTNYTKRSAGIVQIGEGNYFRSGLAFYTNNTADQTTDWQERMRIDKDGNVGIGTTSPSAKLDVNGDIIADGMTLDGSAGTRLTLSRGNGQSSIKASGSDSNAHYLALDSSGGGGALILNHYVNENVWLATGGGNVGIGTTSPGQKLQVSGDAKIDTFLTVGDTAQANTYLYLLSSTSGTSNLRMGDTDTDAGAIIYSNASDFMGFRVNASERMRIDSSGNVLIGRTTVTGASGKFEVEQKDSSTGGIIINTSDATKLPRLHFRDGVGATDVDGVISASDGLRFYTSNTSERMRINTSGNVGIGTTSPDASFKLDVNGAGRFVNDLYADEDLVVANNIYLTDTNTALTEGLSNSVRIQTNSGYIDIGAQNTSYAHIKTDRAQFYFDKKIVLDTGTLDSYDEDLQLRRARSSTDKIVIKDTQIDFDLEGSNKLRILSSGGITFNGDTSTANALDDYEEGSWTPAFSPQSDIIDSVTYDSLRFGRYTKIGDTVHVWGRIRTDVLTFVDNIDALNIDGLPFTPATIGTAGTDTFAGTVGYASAWGGDDPWFITVDSGADKIKLWYKTSFSGNISRVQTNDAGSGANSNDLIFQITYKV